MCIRDRFGCGGSTYNASGTDELIHVVDAGTLQVGTARMTLTVFLDINQITRQTTKTVEFITFGKPAAPTITSPDTYDSNLPTITWDTQDQASYRVTIGDYDSGWLNGLIVSFTPPLYFADGGYTLSLIHISEPTRPY